MFGICFADKLPRDWRDLKACNWDLYEAITEHMISKGVMPETDGLEPFFLCCDHTEENAAETLQAFEEGLKLALK
jgi:glutamate-1-semialdehyde aminotransferase